MRWDNPCSHGRMLNHGHLGGTSDGGDPDSWFPELWDWLVRLFAAESVLDVGCGLGYAQLFFEGLGCVATGLEGSPEVAALHKTGRVVVHDLSVAPYLGGPYDLVWCCELAEHVKEEKNVVDTLVKATGRCLAFCAAPLDAGGHHHVNCQNPPHWVEAFTRAGLTYRADLTEHARGLCPEAYGRSPRNYFRRSGLIFTR